MKHLYTAIISLLACIGLAGEFAKQKDGSYLYTGVITATDVPLFEDILKDEFVRLTIDSPGGSMMASIELGELTMQNRWKIQITAKQCYSGAAMWTVADDDWKYFDNKSFVAFHLPYFSAWYTPTEADWLLTGYEFGHYLYKCLGEEKTYDLMLALQRQREFNGTNGWIVWFDGWTGEGRWDFEEDDWDFNL